jgi:hypothetical protein
MTPKRNAKKSAAPVKSTFKEARPPANPVERKILAYVQRKNPAMMEITMALRILIKKTVPKSRELLNPWGLPTYEWRGAIGYIMVGKKHVTFGFARGSELPDPAKLLEGTGKNLRHVKIRDKAQLVDANLRDLILSAVSLNRRDPQKSKILPTVTGGKSKAADGNIDAIFAGMDRIRANSKKPKDVSITELRDDGRR